LAYLVLDDQPTGEGCVLGMARFNATLAIDVGVCLSAEHCDV